LRLPLKVLMPKLLSNTEQNQQDRRLTLTEHTVTGPAGDNDEASIRLMVHALVRSLNKRAHELAERAVRQGTMAGKRAPLQKRQTAARALQHGMNRGAQHGSQRVSSWQAHTSVASTRSGRGTWLPCSMPKEATDSLGLMQLEAG
jgi:hypothetical protein